MESETRTEGRRLRPQLSPATTGIEQRRLPAPTFPRPGALGPLHEHVDREHVVHALAAPARRGGARVDGEPELAVSRELAAELRAYGVGGGPPPYGPKDRSRFLDALENVLRSAKKAR